MTNINLTEYTDFVKKVTSKSSENLETFIERLNELSNSPLPLNVSLLITGSSGICSEGGEFGELVKKLLFQGKPWNEDTKIWMKKELGDLLWYWITSCRAIGVDPNEVIAENVRKLESRYPGGKFSVQKSENRKEGDL